MPITPKSRIPTASCRGCWHKHIVCTQSGFQLIELALALAITAVLAAVAIASYSQYRDKVNNAVAVADITTIVQTIERFYTENNNYPDALSQMGMDSLKDPWGNSYQYLRISGGNIRGNGRLRKDRNLVPINSDYDLYSMGKDGTSVPPLTAAHSRDDIVRANNGKFIGLAADY